MKQTRKSAPKIITLLFIAAIACAGCVNVGKLTKDLSRDNATVSASVSTVYGTMKIVRSNPTTNQTVTVSPDGTITIGSK